MARIRLVADSTADLTPAYREQHDVPTVPLLVIFGDEEFRDGVDLTPAEFYARMRTSSHHPRTSQPRPADFEQVFRQALEDADTVVCTTLSSAMSGTHESALAARAALPDRDIRVIDTRSCGPGHGNLVRALVPAVAAGAPVEEVERIAAHVIHSQRLVFTVESLESLRRGGRIGGARALLGSVLNIKPVLEVRDGTVEPLDRVRTYAKALDRLVQEVADAGSPQHVTLVHADAEERARTLVARLEPLALGAVEIGEVGPVIGCHGGPGSVAVCFHPPVG